MKVNALKKQISELETKAEAYIQNHIKKITMEAEADFARSLIPTDNVKKAVKNLTGQEIDSISYELEIQKLPQGTKISIVPKTIADSIAIRLIEAGSGSFDVYAKKSWTRFKQQVKNQL